MWNNDFYPIFPLAKFAFIWFSKYFNADGPRDVILSPVSKVYHPGEVIKCSASGNPLPDFSWEDGSGVMISDGPELIITNNMVGRGLKEIRCLAVNTVGRSNSTILAFEVKERGEEQNENIIYTSNVIFPIS